MGHCHNTINIDAPIDKIWETISNFHDLSWAAGVITSLRIVGTQQGHEIGARRVLNDAFHETLTTVNAEQYTFSYSIDDGPGPVAKDAVDNYIGVVKLVETSEGTLVKWDSSFESANNQEVADFCDPIYQGLLSALKETCS